MGSKYVYYNDLQLCWERGQSLVIYHHMGERTGRPRRVDKKLMPGAGAEALWGRAYSAPLPPALTAGLLRLRVAEIESGPQIEERVQRRKATPVGGG